MSLFRRRGLFSSGRDRDPLVGSGGYGGRLLLAAPSIVAFAIAVVLALAAVLIRYTEVRIPIINSAYVFELLLIGFAVLAVSVLVGGRSGRF